MVAMRSRDDGSVRVFTRVELNVLQLVHNTSRSVCDRFLGLLGMFVIFASMRFPVPHEMILLAEALCGALTMEKEGKFAEHKSDWCPPWATDMPALRIFAAAGPFGSAAGLL